MRSMRPTKFGSLTNGTINVGFEIFREVTIEKVNQEN